MAQVLATQILLSCHVASTVQNVGPTGPNIAFYRIYAYRTRTGTLFRKKTYSMHLDYYITRNILDCDQSNYSSRIILSHIPAKLLS